MRAPPIARRCSAPWSSARCRARARHEEIGARVMPVSFEVNGKQVSVEVEPRMTLADCLRHVLRLTGTHVGCEHGVCGACTILVDGAAVRACLMFAIQADGAEVTTVEGLAGPDEELSRVQAAFRRFHGLQCGFCTPGFVVSVTAFLRDHPDPD